MAQNDLFDSQFRELLELKSKFDTKLAFVVQLASVLGVEMPQLAEAMAIASQSNGSPIIPGAATPLINRSRGLQVKAGDFFGKSLAESVKIYLERRAEAVDFDEILEALRQGGFSMRPGDAEEKRIRLNLLKSANLVLIPPNHFGLTSQFPRRPGRPRGGSPSIAEKHNKKAKAHRKRLIKERGARGGQKQATADLGDTGKPKKTKLAPQPEEPKQQEPQTTPATEV